MGAIAHVRIGQVAKRAKLSNDHVRRVFDVITAFLEEETEVRIQDFGTFTPGHVEEREVKSPLVPNGVALRPAGRVVAFRMAKGLRLQWLDRKPEKTAEKA